MSDVATGPHFTEGWVDATVAGEVPGLRLAELTVEHNRGRRAPRELRRSLAMLSDRFRGPDALLQRTWPVPAAYRELYRQLGLDPDADPPPIEAAGRERLRRGAFKARGRLASALLLALVETGVPLWAMDAERLDGPLGIRQARAGERLGSGEYASDVAPGRLVVADAERPVAMLFGALSQDHEVTRATSALRLFTVAAPGVPEAHVSEAFWIATSALS